MFEPKDILKGKILVVDDVADNVEMMTALLGFAGFENVEGTTNPYDVVARHQACDYDLILLDIQMPGIDGFEVMRRMRAIEPAPILPVIAVTAHHDYKSRVIEAGACDFIRKPFEFGEVMQRISDAVEARLLHKRLSRVTQNDSNPTGRDPVTQMVNRSVLVEQIDRVCRSAGPDAMAGLLVFDIDGIERVAQSEGANRSYWLIKELASRIVKSVRSNDAVARLGASQFAVFMPGVRDPAGMESAAHSILEVVTQSFPIDQAKGCIRLDASVGVSVCHCGTDHAAQLLDRAMAAMTQAKARGGNCIFTAE